MNTELNYAKEIYCGRLLFSKFKVGTNFACIKILVKNEVLMKKNILILDDDSDILFFCSQVFESMGFNVVTSGNCNEITKKVEDVNAHIILIDNWIPDIGGIKAIKILKETTHLRDIPVILFSANSNLVELAKEAGADSYLKKPFDLDELEKTVLDLL